MIKIAPSILSADFARLGAEIADVQAAGADYVHVDVMDGQFVPNITIGVPVVKSLRCATEMFLDVHLMVTKPLRFAAAFCEAGADLINFHVEADSREGILRAIDTVKSLGKKCGVTLRPKTPASALEPFLNQVDLILLMTVEPGFGGQSFMPELLPKIRQARQLIDLQNHGCELEVDGGIDPQTARLVVDCGADVLVAGSAVFRTADRAEAIRALRGE